MGVDEGKSFCVLRICAADEDMISHMRLHQQWLL